MRTIKLDPDKLFFTSDTHFGHKNIIKYCNRPFKTVEEMNEALIENWNKIVPRDGVVVHCGDFTYPFKDSNIIDQYQKYFSQLKGSIILIRGNHDEIPLGVYESINNLGTRSFEVHDQLMFNVDGVGMFASHYPATVFPGQYQVFGHLHTLKDDTSFFIKGKTSDVLKPTQYDVGVDQNDFRPISYWELCNIFKQR